MKNFKVGDIIRGTSESRYHRTDVNMTKGKVVKVISSNEISVEILEHKTNQNYIGDTWEVDPSYFELVDKVVEVKNNGMIKTVIEGDVTFLTISDKTTLAIPTGVNIGISLKHSDDKFNEEIGKAIAFYRMDKGGI